MDVDEAVANLATWYDQAGNITTNTNNETTDSSTANVGNLNIQAAGSQFYSGTFVNQLFAPAIYKQLVTVAEQRYNAKIRTMVVPTSLRTMISDQIGTSNTSINRRNVEKGDTVATYEGKGLPHHIAANQEIFALAA